MPLERHRRVVLARGVRGIGSWPRSLRRRRCRSRLPGPAPVANARPCIAAAISTGGSSFASRPYSSSNVASRSTWTLRTRCATWPTSALRSGRWLAAANSSTISAAPRRSEASFHQVSNGCSESSAAARRSAFGAGAAFEHGDEQIVERREVVVDQRRVDADPRRDAPRAHRRVAVLEHDLLGRVEESLSLLRGRRGDVAVLPCTQPFSTARRLR